MPNELDKRKVALGSTVSTVSYNKLTSQKKTILDENGKKLMKDMLSIWDDGHCIYICHPNHLFKVEPITSHIKEIKNINWNDIEIQKMFKVNDYKTFMLPDFIEAFKYVHNRLGHQIISEVQKNNKIAVSYLVVVEKYIFDNEDNYLVRGIIRGDYDGYSLAFNPEYEEAIPKSVFDRSLRFGGHDVSKVYCLQRKNG